jgi:hypothetical protein
MAETSRTPPFLWLHIKKSGGQSIRRAIGSAYVETARKNACPYIALPEAEWNDNLNNFRIPLGPFDYRRMLFARDYLYQQDFHSRFKFTVVRNPYARAVSAWRYLTRRGIIECFWPRYRYRYRFTDFLGMLPDVWERKSNRQLATHTAPIWPDISDDKGAPLVDFIANLETIEEDFQVVAQQLELPTSPAFPRINHNIRPYQYQQAYSRRSRSLVEWLYGGDIENLGYDFADEAPAIRDLNTASGPS